MDTLQREYVVRVDLNKPSLAGAIVVASIFWLASVVWAAHVWQTVEREKLPLTSRLLNDMQQR